MENLKKKIKILLIDDDEMMRIYFRDIFWIHGKSNIYDVEMVSSFEKANELVKNIETRPDTIFLDVLMSSKGAGCNAPAYQMALSLAFISGIKKNNELSCINIIIYSGQKDEILKEEAVKVGVDAYLTKGEIMPKEIISFTDKLHA
ncbi:MAG: response regulator [Candidatus Nomurabacteria bacterium]|nr:response regulator [Candidatus Nomurabacteria bacterium]